MATANVLGSLPADRARRALAGVLELAPDLVGLQEWWTPTRHRALRETGSVGWVPDVGVRLRPRDGARPPAYLWSAPFLGGTVVGARADRFELVGCRSSILSRPGFADRGERRLGVEPPRLATIATYRDRRGDRPVSVVNYHLSPGVQTLGRYRKDRPLLVARHRAEVRRLQTLVDAALALGHDVYALGDSNFDGFRLRGLTSAWRGREEEPGTLGPRRKVDDVHAGRGVPTSVTLLASDSDHKAVVVDHADP